MGDLIIRRGRVFDGQGSPARVRDVRIARGEIAQLSDQPLRAGPGDEVIDATDHWVMPGFIDIHTHYDAEVELDPALRESLCHGVTTVFMGSCSLSAAVGDVVDIADMFTRVEAIPHEYLLSLMETRKTWNTHAEYAAHLDELPLGPNVASFVGYSAVRAAVLGLERSLDPRVRPSPQELSELEAMVEEGFDAGFLGLSLNTLYWDKMGGDRFRSRCLPSTYAKWSEVRRMVGATRKRGLNLQAIPNISTRYELLVYAAFSMGFHLRTPLKTTLVSIMDLEANRFVWRMLHALGWVFNRIFGARFRYQCLPVPFDLWTDGFETVVFEEFGAGAAGLHLRDPTEQSELFDDQRYRRWFRRQWRNPLSPRVFHRNFGLATVVDSPDRSIVNKTFKQIAKERGESDVDVFLDLVARYGPELRWYTVTGNDRPDVLSQLISGEHSLMGFSDAGAHLRNMAFYNFPLRMLKFVKTAADEGRPVMPLERAIWRLTGELASWFDIDAGWLAEGQRADIVVIDPAQLDERVDAVHEEPMPELGGMKRLVRRNPGVVAAVVVNGVRVVDRGRVRDELGRTMSAGRFLRTSGSSSARKRARAPPLALQHS